jgi:predicted lipoprotein with Yx(FWY)xxD motif
MKKNLALVVALSSGVARALAGCSGASSSGGSAAGGSSAPPAAASSAPASSGYSASSGTGSGTASGTALATATTSLGKIVVNGSMMTVYVYDKDKANSGKSACVGPCLGFWPPVFVTGATPKVTGVTGKVGTIDVSGKKQVTINGLPLYTFSGDHKTGDVTGQGFKGIWWVVSPSGAKIAKM